MIKSNKISISLAQKSDKDILFALAKQDHEEGVFASMPFSKVKFENLFNKAINKKAICLVAKIRDKTIGFIYATLGGYFIADSKPIATVNVVYVKKEIRETLAGGKAAVYLSLTSTFAITENFAFPKVVDD